MGWIQVPAGSGCRAGPVTSVAHGLTSQHPPATQVFHRYPRLTTSEKSFPFLGLLLGISKMVSYPPKSFSSEPLHLQPPLTACFYLSEKSRIFPLVSPQPPLLPAKMLTGRFDSLVSDASLTRATDGQESHLPAAHI